MGREWDDVGWWVPWQKGGVGEGSWCVGTVRKLMEGVEKRKDGLRGRRDGVLGKERC